MQSPTANDSTPSAVKIEYSMRKFIPNQGILYNYFQIMKNHGYIDDVIVYREKKRYRIGISSLSSDLTSKSNFWFNKNMIHIDSYGVSFFYVFIKTLSKASYIQLGYECLIYINENQISRNAWFKRNCSSKYKHMEIHIS